MKDQSLGKFASLGFRMTLGVLAVVLAVLFWRSFLPGVVQFSNDGPLGAQMAAWLQLPSAFFGMWVDLNSLGSNAGGWPVDLNGLFRWLLGPIGYSKFFGPIALLILGVGAWYCFRQLRLTPAAALLGALATMLNSAFFSTSCWGLSGQLDAFALDFVAVGLVVGTSPTARPLTRWVRLALAGLAIGMNVMEAADIGAIFSIAVAAFVVAWSVFANPASPVRSFMGGMGKVAVISIFALFIAFQTVNALIGIQIKGVAGTQQDDQTRAQKWDWATQWSLPKAETLGVAVPGLFGYRMDTTDGGNYWGGVGRDAAWDRYFDGGRQGPQPAGILRFSGTSYYTGILVLLCAAWTIVQTTRKSGSVYSPVEKRCIWFWSGLAVIALLLAWGRFAPFYQFVFALPYFSTIRNPTKFLYIFNFAATILFAYGIHGLWKRHVAGPLILANGLNGRLSRWWRSLAGLDRKWAVGSMVVLGGALLATLLYSSSRAGLEQHLGEVGFPGVMGKSIAAFSIGQAWIFIGYLAAATGLLCLVSSGAFSGRRSNWFVVVVGMFLIADLGRANLPFIMPVDYVYKYDLGLKNPVLEFLKQRPHEQRVAALPFPVPEQLELLNQVYRIEWAQHHFLFHNIQSLDVIQMPRMPVDLEAFEKAWSARGVAGLLRKWELTNTRYLLGPAGFVEGLNAQLDPAQKRFSARLPFAIQPKPGVTRTTQLEDLTAVASPGGPYAVIEFAGALPRASLYANWIVSTNDAATLTNLFDPSFDPRGAVFVAREIPAPAVSSNTPAGTVEFASYAPKDIRLKVDAKTTAVLLLNDRYDAGWKVFVDGQEQPLLRCNFIMRGVQVPPGQHTVQFTFRMPMRPFYVTVAALGVGVLLLGLLVATRQREDLEGHADKLKG